MFAWSFLVLMWCGGARIWYIRSDWRNRTRVGLLAIHAREHSLANKITYDHSVRNRGRCRRASAATAPPRGGRGSRAGLLQLVLRSGYGTIVRESPCTM
ncbi:hypothetical protein DE146DRAFT_141814 [Phaeosphaeria sp. MPI-PUGE-AT-0046c]|nr:hypothetical protein DE146DRAFT_141814 [Phaeosphaeria sp. MPI-PUGE-AT-0046c]